MLPCRAYSRSPTASPTTSPTRLPSGFPTQLPTKSPTESPTTSEPTASPTLGETTCASQEMYQQPSDVLIAIDVWDRSDVAEDRTLRGAALVVRKMLIRPTDVRLAVVCYDQVVRQLLTVMLGQFFSRLSSRFHPAHAVLVFSAHRKSRADPNDFDPIAVFRSTRVAWPPSTAGIRPPRPLPA